MTFGLLLPGVFAGEEGHAPEDLPGVVQDFLIEFVPVAQRGVWSIVFQPSAVVVEAMQGRLQRVGEPPVDPAIRISMSTKSWWCG